MSPSVKRIFCKAIRHFGVRRSRNSRSIPKCLNSSLWAFSMIAFASASGSSDMRCSYQPMASASSVIDVIMRANVRVSALSSLAGSWYCSKPISGSSRRWIVSLVSVKLSSNRAVGARIALRSDQHSAIAAVARQRDGAAAPFPVGGIAPRVGEAHLAPEHFHALADLVVVHRRHEHAHTVEE